MLGFLQLLAAQESSRTLLYSLELKGTQTLKHMVDRLAPDVLCADPPTPTAVRHPAPRHTSYFAAYQFKPFGPGRYVP